MNIRNATRKDIAVIVALCLRYMNGVPTWGLVARTEDEIRQLDTRFIWVVEDDNELIGYAICLPRENDGSCIYTESDKILALDEIYLVPEARSKGIGSQLLQRIYDCAKINGFTKLLVYSSVKDIEPAMKFYRGNGFTTWAVQLFKDIG